MQGVVERKEELVESNRGLVESFITSAHMPLVIEPADKRMKLPVLLDILDQQNAYIKKNLLRYGVLLFRNFPITNEDDFIAVIKHLKTGGFLNYIGGDSPRNRVKEGVFTSTEAPPSVKIPLHNELSFVKKYPTHIYFYCSVAPEADGETIIADARKVYQALDPDVKKRFESKELHYLSCYHHDSPAIHWITSKGHRSWYDVFETNDKKEVERLCRENEFGFKWNRGGWLQISQRRPAVLSHPETHEKVWFNQAHLFDFNPKFLGWWRYLGTKVLYCLPHMRLHQVFFGDGTKIPQSDFYHILDTLDTQTVKFPWQKGDIMLCDNILAMHGRATYQGKRRILTAMTG